MGADLALRRQTEKHVHINGLKSSKILFWRCLGKSSGHAILIIVKSSAVWNLGVLYAESEQTLQGSLSAVSKPNFASKHSLESSRRDLHNALLCTVLYSQLLLFLLFSFFFFSQFYQFSGKNVISEQCKGVQVHCVDLGESFPTSIYLQNLASIQPRTSRSKFGSQITLLITYRASCKVSRK